MGLVRVFVTETHKMSRDVAKRIHKRPLQVATSKESRFFNPIKLHRDIW